MEKGFVAYGIELECAIPDNISKRSINELGWYVKSDASLRFNDDDWKAVELVTPIFQLRELVPLLNKLRDYLGGTDSNLDGILINKSCGGHIHFSWQVKNSMVMNLPVRTMKWMREQAFKRVTCYDSFIGQKFQDQYTRSYAQTVDKNLVVQYRDKYREFHFTPHMGVEWRGFNFQGVRKWADLKAVAKIGCQVIEDALQTQIYDGDQFELSVGKMSDVEAKKLDAKIKKMWDASENSLLTRTQNAIDGWIGGFER